MNTDSKQTPNENQEKQYVSQFSDRAKNATKTALLWVAALIIIWLTGLEGIMRDVTTRFNAIEETNQSRQKFENRVVESYYYNKDRNLRLRLEQDRIDEEERLPKYKEELKKQSKNPQRHEDLRIRIERIESRKKDQTKTVDERKKEILTEREAIKAEEQYYQERFKTIQNEHEARQKELKAIKEQRKGVSFDIVGQKFEVPPLYAPAIWCLALVGLIAYLFRARSAMLTLSGNVLQTHQPDASGSSKRALSGAPWWLAPLPATRHSSSADHQDQLSTVSAQRMRDAFGWNPLYHSMANVLTILCLLLFFIAQMRVVWLGLVVSRKLSDHRGQVFIPTITILITILTLYSIWLWFQGPHLQIPGKSIKRQVLFFIILLALLLAFSIWVWNRPRETTLISGYFESSFFYISLCGAIGVIAFGAYKSISSTQSAVARTNRKSEKSIHRRKFLYGTIAMVGTVGLALLWFRRTKARNAQFHNPRYVKKNRKTTKQVVDFPSGFYSNPESDIIHFVSTDKFVTGYGDIDGLSFLTPFYELALPIRSKSGRNKWANYIYQQDGKTKQGSLRMNTESVEPSEPPQNSGSARSNEPLDQVLVATEPKRHEKKTLKPQVQLEQAEPQETERSPKMADSILLSIGKVASNELKEKKKKPRVHLTRSSQAFEQAVAFILQGKQMQAQDYDKVCELLIYSINHDLYYKSKINKLPGFRLYDLVAGISIRYNRPKYLKELIRLIEDFGLSQLFNSRKKQWQDTNSSWYNRWTNTQRPVKWDGLWLK